MSETIRTEVAIIGAGPAGATLGALLASRGIDTLLLDRDVFPRDKVCGEFLSYDAWPIVELLGVDGILDRAGAPEIAECRVVGDRHGFAFGFPSPARGISRLLFDVTLVEAAGAAGARRMDGWSVTHVSTGTSPAVVTVTSPEGAERRIEAVTVVGAWGRWGRIDLQLGRKFSRETTERHFGFKRHYCAIDGAALPSIDLYSFDRGYLGVARVEGGRTNICGLVHASRIEQLRGGWEAFVLELRKESGALDRLFGSHEPAQEQFLTSDPVIFRARSAVEQGIVLTGDAAGLIDPLAGNGMAMALQSALLAAPFVMATVRGGEDRPRIEQSYAAAHTQLFARRIRWSRRIARLLSRPRLLGASLALARSPAIGRFLLSQTRANRDFVRRMCDVWAGR